MLSSVIVTSMNFGLFWNKFHKYNIKIDYLIANWSDLVAVYSSNILKPLKSPAVTGHNI